MPDTTATYLLTGDVGGTNSRMSLYDVRHAEPLMVNYYRNAEHLPAAKLSDPNAFPMNIVVPFLELCWNQLGQGALVPLADATIISCIATAGVVTDNAAKLTNLGNLLIDGNQMQANTSNKYLKCIQRCLVINDFVAQGYGCLTLKESEVRHLNGPKLAPKDLINGPKVCVGAGTGLGECYLTQTNGEGDYTCFPSEGGHVEYAPRNDVEVSLFKYLNNKFSSKGRISVERVVSGKGLANVYEFLAHQFPEQIDKKIHKEFLGAEDQQGRVVAVNAKPGSLCRQAMSIMMSAYGCEAGSAAIKWIPTGGLFVTGGLTPKNIEYIEGTNTDFMISYLNKGRVAPVLEKIPLYAVMVEDLGVRGAHKAALMEYERLFSDGRVHAKSSKAGQDLQEHVWTAVATAAALGFCAGALMGPKFLK